MPHIPGGACPLCDQVVSVSGHHPCGAVWCVMGSSRVNSWCCFSTTRSHQLPLRSSTSMVSWGGQASTESAALFFPLCLAMDTGHSGWDVVSAPLWPAPTAAGGCGGVGRFPRLQLFSPPGDGSCLTAATTHCTASLPLSLGSASMCTATKARMLPLPLWSPAWLCNQTLHCYHIHCGCGKPRLHLQLPSLSFPGPAFPAHPINTPTFRCLNEWISEVFVCWVVVVQFITLRGQTRFFHYAMMWKPVYHHFFLIKNLFPYTFCIS